MKNDNGNEALAAALACTFGLPVGTAAVIGGSGLVETTTEQSFTGIVEPFSIINGSGLPNGSQDLFSILTLTYVADSVTGLSADPEIIVFLTEDKRKYTKIEQTAERIYNTFNSNHEIKTAEMGLLLPDIETAKRLEDVLKNGTKEEVYQALTALQELLEEEKDKEEKITLKLKEK